MVGVKAPAAKHRAQRVGACGHFETVHHGDEHRVLPQKVVGLDVKGGALNWVDFNLGSIDRRVILFLRIRSAPRNSTRFAAPYLARGRPCERFASSLAGRRASLGVGWLARPSPWRTFTSYSLPANWRTPSWVKMRRTQREQISSATKRTSMRGAATSLMGQQRKSRGYSISSSV